MTDGGRARTIPVVSQVKNTASRNDVNTLFLEAVRFSVFVFLLILYGLNDLGDLTYYYLMIPNQIITS